MKRLRVFGTTGGAALVAAALLLAPALAATQRQRAARPATFSFNGHPVGSFTPAVSDPRLAALLAQRGGPSLDGDFRFTPALSSGERSRRVQVAIRARSSAPADTQRTLGLSSASAVTAITPSSYNLGVSIGWRRFALSGDVAQQDNGLIQGTRETTQIGMSYRATRHITGRVAVASEQAQGNQRLIAEDEAYQLDVGGAYSIARNVDVTAGARYRIAHDRLEPLAQDSRRDSQAVYVGTAFRF